ncbi:ribosomal protein S18-alanine N-acetyltransferase [Celerinatantimonas diazotrophica]|uniref:[Ribosomal protein bS18]-alanine N-acetyltransferase n=1 Tax=Celerinatantimonas diazotrophica TaxID=412034 RepID=A0A4R1J920_9GAMM|nr:ribosomal protein S18-alanine N-acetyltransferase [Celerinatantimonas diazotrophica]TCK47076.1 ribosomal-protein-alanine N-acetyltransferase [Celerinatantimonas diazotrophica]CAG9295845.1 [Ribosomal protein S18]-alanine N-acetyltransferase [Celerinatantimonas diazotrophica]
MPYMVKPLLESRVGEILAIEQSVQCHPWSARLFEQSFSSRSVNLAIEDCHGDIAGYLFSQVIVDEAELLNISIAKNHQRHGLASQLLTHWIKYLNDQSVTRCLLEVRQSNEAAIALYQKFGFTLDGIRKGYYPCPHGREDACLMTFLLEQTE